MPPLDNTIGQRLEREAPVTHSRHVEDDSRNEIVLATASRRVGLTAASSALRSWFPQRRGRIAQFGAISIIPGK
jgi:hypothetical protein